jgi:hypothetical protein
MKNYIQKVSDILKNLSGYIFEPISNSHSKFLTERGPVIGIRNVSYNDACQHFYHCKSKKSFISDFRSFRFRRSGVLVR